MGLEDGGKSGKSYLSKMRILIIVLQYNIFKKDHGGGKHYDISKMSRAERKQYEL